VALPSWVRYVPLYKESQWCCLAPSYMGRYSVHPFWHLRTQQKHTIYETNGEPSPDTKSAGTLILELWKNYVAYKLPNLNSFVIAPDMHWDNLAYVRVLSHIKYVEIFVGSCLFWNLGNYRESVKNKIHRQMILLHKLLLCLTLMYVCMHICFVIVNLNLKLTDNYCIRNASLYL
jgi:hypothetical protein